MKAVYQQPQTVQSVAREPHKCERVLGHKICMHSLAARPKTHLLQIGTYDVSIHPRHLSVLPTVMFHPRFRHDIQTTAAVFYLTSSGSSAGSSLYSQQAGFSGFGWCHRLERPASPRRICAVTRSFPCFSVHTKTLSCDSCVTITIHHYCVDTCGPCNN